VNYMDSIDGFLKPAAGRNPRVGAVLAEAVREIVSAGAERTIERGQIISFLRSNGWSTADIEAYIVGGLAEADAEAETEPPPARGMAIRENWLNGNRTDALEAARGDAAGSVCAVAAMLEFDSRETVGDFSNALIRADENYRG